MSRKKPKFSVKAIKVSNNEQEFYLAAISVKKLFSMTAVTRAEENNETGYQRNLAPGRVKRISEYLNGGSIIPGSLILSSNEKKSVFDEKTSELTLSNKESSLLVIDGQHRLYGAYQSEVDVVIPVCIFYGLDKTTEVQYFLDINGNQIGVPKTLRLELEKFTAEEESDEYLLKTLFDELDENPLSPLCGKMARTKSVSGKISHVAFQSAIKPILDKAPFKGFDVKQKKKVIINFLRAVESILQEIFDDSKKVSNAAFFQAVLGAFIDICQIAYTRSGGYKKENFEDVLSTLEKINWTNHAGTNKAAIKSLTEDIKHAITEKSKVSDELF